jgi:type IV pilus biogenesis protein CpaD/CtpE
MKFRAVLLALVLGLIVGCGSKEDPNKNLKPIDPNTPPPKPAVESKSGGNKKDAPADKPAPVVQ